MTERVGRHASQDPGETVILRPITGDEGQQAAGHGPLDRPASGRHAAQPGPAQSRQAPSQQAPAQQAPAQQAPAQQAPASAAGRRRPPPVAGDNSADRYPAAPFEPAARPAGPVGYNSANGHSSPNGTDHPEPAPQPARQRRGSGSRQIRLVWVYPDLLSTYGDRGNLLVLSRRAQLRGLEVTAVEVNSDERVPEDGDIYLLGGGEDLPQILAADRLRGDGGLAGAAERGAVVFAVCAGYQLIGRQFGGVDGEPVAGLGILDVTSGRGERRAVGEIVADVDPALGAPRLTGFENHQGVTHIGPAARPLARVSLGIGNGDGTEGAYAGTVLGTYLHGPALARNPGLADLLLGWVAGPLQPLAPSAENWARRLREERLAATSS